MKKNYFILPFVLLIVTISTQAQVVNGNFETIKSNFLPSNWGMNHFQQVSIDPVTGQNTSDSIMYTWCIPSMCYASFEPQTGEYAMELSNAYNQTQNRVIAGEAVLFNDETQDMPLWNPGVSIAPGTEVSVLGFYYKFLPVGNDIAQANITVFDADGNEIGTASIDIIGMHNEYEYIYTTINYTSNAAPSYMFLSFTMAKEGSEPTFGSRLIVDNVVTSFAALNVNQNQLTSFSVYPTLVDDVINIIPSSQSKGAITYSIINTEGRLIKQSVVSETNSYVYSMNVNELSSGIYFLKIESNSQNLLKKFIKK